MWEQENTLLLAKKQPCCSNYFRKEELGIKAEGVINHAESPETRHDFILERERKIRQEV